MRGCVAAVLRPSSGTRIRSASSAYSVLESSPIVVSFCVLLASMLAVTGSGMTVLRSCVMDGAASSERRLPNSFFREKEADMVCVRGGLSADAQELRLLRQRLQVAFLPVRAAGS